MRLIVAIMLLAALTGCATAPRLPACPAGQQWLRTAQMFFGRNAGGKTAVSEAEFRKFADEELTPRFPDGLTILDGGGQWRGEENRLIREAAKVVLIVLPKSGDASAKIEAVRNAYKARYRQESVMLVTQASCVSF